ncbi:class I SAM-dependent methyltransferase [Ilyobacter polytropus]|uniref:Methyltransferase type 12 n=1 Tax=Ilyobacter polytropus (strain ATCC 51220 / DSM 2926 / LMG 16218 / CuHBu1) TaxID=572544 RepID=E3HDZ1_ILYPC|nr:class I SAM-dependent methyltransferase [Ilyobacter polytropus]ADO84603.1 Methyltransferase type 12 [Ilyobacter polytropus DSM 2926]
MFFRKNSKSHWDKIYSGCNRENLGWYEKEAKESLNLIVETGIKKNIIDIGCGKTTLIESLLEMGYDNITGIDLSEIAIGDLKESLAEYCDRVNLFQCDVLSLKLDEKVDIWHDRAVLHFLNSEKDENLYFDQLRRYLNEAGYFILATFSKDNKNRCSGLKIRTWDECEVLERLGNNFKLLKAYDQNYTMPSGDGRKFRYMMFKKN